MQEVLAVNAWDALMQPEVRNKGEAEAHQTSPTWKSQLSTSRPAPCSTMVALQQQAGTNCCKRKSNCTSGCSMPTGSCNTGGWRLEWQLGPGLPARAHHKMAAGSHYHPPSLQTPLPNSLAAAARSTAMIEPHVTGRTCRCH